MKTIIAGPREGGFTYRDVCHLMRNVPWKVTEVVSGRARGVDRLGELWARIHGIPVIPFPADWDGPLGIEAGFARNESMAEYADALAALWGGSSGTRDMIERAMDHNLKIKIILHPDFKEL